MSATYLFMRPTRLPLAADSIDASAVRGIDPDDADRHVREAFPGFDWAGPATGSGQTDAGWIELQPLPPRDGGALAMRCSLRGDYRAIVQALCDRSGWVAFDEASTCYQPLRAPTRV